MDIENRKGIVMGSAPKMHEKQVENLLKLSPEERLEYFVRYCADFEQVWGLVVEEEDWILFKDQQGKEIFPIWPHESLAQFCCFQEFKQLNAKPQKMTLSSFLEKCIPDMITSNVLFGVFYDTNRIGLTVDGDYLKLVIEEEINLLDDE